MALSMRLVSNESQDDETEQQFDHFLLEAFGHCVRLEGSPHAFASLPLLLEHYSQPEALQELKCRLRLPEAILRCDSIQALQGLALMGQGKCCCALLSKNGARKARERLINIWNVAVKACPIPTKIKIYCPNNVVKRNESNILLVSFNKLK